MKIMNQLVEKNFAVISCIYGSDKKRIDSATFSIKENLNQIGNHTYIIIELLFNDEKSNYPFLKDLKNVIHLEIHRNDLYKDIMQKECLYNLAIKLIENYKYLVFLDTEMCSEDRLWFCKIKQKIEENPYKIIQGFSEMRDTIDDVFKCTSLARGFIDNILHTKKNKYFAPGGCWAMTKEIFEEIKGWNPWGVGASGDALFVMEDLSLIFFDKDIVIPEYFSDQLRDKKKKFDVDFVDVKIIHINHGPYSDRRSERLREVWNEFRPITNYLELDEDGLLRWKDENSPLRQALKERRKTFYNKTY